MYPGVGGTLIIDDSLIIVSSEISANGQTGGRGNQYAGWPIVDGGYSTYDGTHTGYGAGGCAGSLPNGVGGYCLIERESDETDWTRRVVIHTDWRHFYTIKSNNNGVCQKNVIRTYYKTIFEQNVPGEYTLELSEGNYIVHLVGAGGGAAKARATTDRWYMASGTGGSGAYWNGLLRLNGIYTLTIGAGGTTAVSGWNGTATGTNGGATSISNVIQVGGGTGSVYNLYSSPRNPGYGGTVTVFNTAAVVDIYNSKKGLDGTTAGSGATRDSSGFPNLPRTLSVYDNSVDGYGAGAGTNNGDAINPNTVALDGFARVYRKSDATDYDFYIDVVKILVVAKY